MKSIMMNNKYLYIFIIVVFYFYSILSMLSQSSQIQSRPAVFYSIPTKGTNMFLLFAFFYTHRL